MKITIRDKNAAFIDAFKHFDYSKMINLECGEIFDDTNRTEYSNIVSPANSFGFMNGGIDQVYINKFGQQLEDRVRKIIKTTHRSELLVGQAIATPTMYCKDDEGEYVHSYLIVAPTMRVPQRIIDPVDIYLATKAAIYEARDIALDSLTFPGMGTGVGMVPYYTAAKNMLIGIRDALEGMKTFDTCAQSYLDNEKFKV